MAGKKRPEDIGEIVVNTDTLAKLFGFTRQRINQLAKEGILEKKGPGRWPLLKNVQKYIEFLRASVNERNDEKAQALYWHEKALHEKAKREIAEIRLARLKNQVHDAADVEFVITNMLVTFRNRVLSIPDKLAPKVIGVKNLYEISETIRQELQEALMELSEYDPAMFVGEDDDAEDDQTVSEDIEERSSPSEVNS